MATNGPIRRVVYFLQKRFFSATPSSKTPKKSSTITKTKIKTEIFAKIPPQSPSFSIQYLTEKCGLSLDSAISASKRHALEEKNKKQLDAVVSFLKSHNFSDTQITKLIEKQPGVLHCRISSNLEPKIQFLAENGIKGLNLPKVVVSSPAIFFRSLDAQLKPAMALIKRFVTCPTRTMVVFGRGAWILNSDWKLMQQNVDYLIEKGVLESRIEELIVLQPRFLYQDISRMIYAVEMIKCMGVKPCDLVFIHTLRVVLSLSELSWKKKVSIFESLGWSNDEVISTFTRSPHCFSCSEAKIRKAMDYLVNTAKLDKETIIGYPKILMYSVEKRVIPRHTVWKILKERKLIKGTKFIWVLNKSEKDFIAQYINKYSDEIPYLLHIFLGCKDSIRAVRN